MATSDTHTAQAWAIFDQLIADATQRVTSNPWTKASGGPTFNPDYDTLRRLLGVPLKLGAPTQSGVPALALDVWLAYELRRAGFHPDAVWPRATHPRVMPKSISTLLEKLPRKERAALNERLTKKTPPSGTVASSASILGKHYLKQVDVVMSDWDTGPELLISTKRMDSSFGRNAANRVEESYGDAKNLRLRHPLAALGFLYGLRSTIYDESPDKAAWLEDLLCKLGQEDDAYHAVCLLVIEYEGKTAPDDEGDGEDPLVDAGIVETEEVQPAELDPETLDSLLAGLPHVTLRHDLVPDHLQAGQFIGHMVRRVINSTPVTMHQEARRLLKDGAAA